MKFSITDLVTFTEEILNGKFHFLCSVNREDFNLLICNLRYCGLDCSVNVQGGIF